MAVLLIDARVKAEIAEAMRRARERVVPFEVMRQMAQEVIAPGQRTETLKLADRKPGFERPREYQSQQVLIPIGYRAAITYEEHPGGLGLHLSISVERADPTRMPSVEAVTAIATAFGIDWRAGTSWLEEYEPGRHAVNIIVMTEPRGEGR